MAGRYNNTRVQTPVDSLEGYICTVAVGSDSFSFEVGLVGKSPVGVENRECTPVPRTLDAQVGVPELSTTFCAGHHLADYLDSRHSSPPTQDSS